MMHETDEYWDTNCRLSQKALYNLAYALVMHDGAITSTFVFGLKTIKNLTRKQNSCNCADFRIRLPFGNKESFEQMSGLELWPPPKIQVN